MAEDKQQINFPIFDLLYTLFGIACGIGGIIAFNTFRQLGYSLITIGLFLLFLNVWKQIKRQLKGDGKNRLLLVINVFALALCMGIILGYFLLGLIG